MDYSCSDCPWALVWEQARVPLMPEAANGARSELIRQKHPRLLSFAQTFGRNDILAHALDWPVSRWNTKEK